MDTYMKKGYLNSEFRLFHLTDRETKEVEYHYHDFNKITIFIKGKVNSDCRGWKRSLPCAWSGWSR